MTLIDRPRPEARRLAARMTVAKYFTWWRDRRVPARLPDHLLHDVGLEHLIIQDRDTIFHRRWQ